VRLYRVVLLNVEILFVSVILLRLVRVVVYVLVLKLVTEEIKDEALREERVEKV
jgi:hypothetical protein